MIKECEHEIGISLGKRLCYLCTKCGKRFGIDGVFRVLRRIMNDEEVTAHWRKLRQAMDGFRIGRRKLKIKP